MTVAVRLTVVSLYFEQLPQLFAFSSLGDIVDHLTNRRVSATHRVKALKRGGWSIGKVKEQRVYWRGDSKPGHIDPDIRSELIDA